MDISWYGAGLQLVPARRTARPEDAARLLKERFAPPLLLAAKIERSLPDVLSRIGIAGAAVYDALVALAATHAGCTLATRDARAKTTYDVIGVPVIVVG